LPSTTPLHHLPQSLAPKNKKARTHQDARHANTPGISRTFALGFTVAISCNLTNTSRVTSSRLGARNPSNPSAMRAKQIINSSVTVDAATSTFTFRVNASKIPATSNNPPPAIINPKLLKGISPIINHLQIHRRGFCDCIAPNSK
jgi:hypothetical protein